MQRGDSGCDPPGGSAYLPSQKVAVQEKLIRKNLFTWVELCVSPGGSFHMEETFGLGALVRLSWPKKPLKPQTRSGKQKADYS